MKGESKKNEKKVGLENKRVGISPNLRERELLFPHNQRSVTA